MKKLAFAGALFALVATNVNAIDVVSKDGKVDFGSRFEATVLTNNVDGGWEMIWGPKEQLWLTERAGKILSVLIQKQVRKPCCIILLMLMRNFHIKAC
ncbi:hypothetical protein [Gallibacterium anatis]|uniref:hypothetical protein n=1 Tax=Gallibacterium anatis TaxID=750 RepID=UPI00211B50F2|nr:hypothetical protein [Gallibacterium anatis]